MWPFAFRLEVHFAIAGDALRMEALVHNPAKTPLWFSFGFHPAFAWPLPGGAPKAAHRLVFAECEPGSVGGSIRTPDCCCPSPSPARLMATRWRPVPRC